MPNVTMLVGIPGCGKSTLAAGLPGVTVSSDEIRRELFGSLRAAHDVDGVGRLRQVFDLFHQRVADHLAAGRDVIADATNLTTHARREIREVAARAGADVHVLVFPRVDRALAANARRDGDARVPDVVQAEMVERLQHATHAIPREGYASVRWVDVDHVATGSRRSFVPATPPRR